MRKFILLVILLSTAAMITAQTVDPYAGSQRAANPNEDLAKVLKTTGTVSLSVGVPCLATGIACLMYANFVPNPVANWTTSTTRATAESGLKLVSAEEYNAAALAFTKKTHAAELAGYVLTPMGGALTIVGIPLYLSGMKLNVNYTGNGVGIALNF